MMMAERISPAPDTIMPVDEIPVGTDKQTMMSTIDGSINEVLKRIAHHKEGPLPQELLSKVQGSLLFLDKCRRFKDSEFRLFAREKATSVEKALKRAQVRIDRKSPQAKEALISSAPTDEGEEKAPQMAFDYEREEEILIKIAGAAYEKKLAFLRGDKIEVLNRKAVTVSMIHEDGVAPFFLFSPEFPNVLKQAIEILAKEKRALLTRRVYQHTHAEQSDADVKRYFENEGFKDIIGIIALGFEDWSGEIVTQGIAGLPSEKKVIGAKKQDDSAKGFGAQLKSLFGLGAKKEQDDQPRPHKTKESNATKTHRAWQGLERRNVMYLSQHFSFSLLAYIMRLSESQFTTEFDCIDQIVNQQDTSDVGPVVSNLSRLYKFYDNIFFDLVILTLFHRKNKFDINMLQAACMAQNFVVNRLPLTMDELRRRPLDHAKHIIRCLRDGAESSTLKRALADYFYVHETIHASKVGKRIQASENYLDRQSQKMDRHARRVIEGCQMILRDIAALKQREKTEGSFLAEEIQEAIEGGLHRIISEFGAL